MQIDCSRIGPFAIAALTVFILYRRLRRSFGRQPIRPVRMYLRIGIFALLGVSLLAVALRSATLLTADLAGTVLGIALALWAARRTRYASQGAQLYYIPHTVTGIAVSLVFAGRLVYRFADDRSLEHLSAPIAADNPVTIGLLFVVVGYYVCYYTLVLQKSRHLRPEDLEISPANSVETIEPR